MKRTGMKHASYKMSQVTRSSFSALCAAAVSGQLEAMVMLATQGAELNLLTPDGSTALMKALLCPWAWHGICPCA